MRSTEKEELRRVARSCFPLWYHIMISTPDHAVIAVDEDTRKIVGGGIYKIFQTPSGPFGYLSWGFVDADYRGRSIGRHIYREVTELFSRKGCTHSTAIVLEDNTASWSLLYHLGYRRAQLTVLIRSFGLISALILWFRSFAATAPGSSFWITGASIAKKRSLSLELLLLLIWNAAAVLLQSLLYQRSMAHALMQGSALLSLLLICYGSEFLLLTRDMHVSFLTWRTGTIIPIFVYAAGGIFPFFGSFYPDSELWDYRSSVKQLGRASAVSWTLTTVIFLLSSLFSSPFFSYLHDYCLIFLLCDVAVVIFESNGGARVRRWSRTTYLLLCAFSVLMLILVLVL